LESERDPQDVLPQRLSEHSGVVDELMALHGALFGTDMPAPPP
jgi:hypothetical protein